MHKKQNTATPFIQVGGTKQHTQTSDRERQRQRERLEDEDPDPKRLEWGTDSRGESGKFQDNWGSERGMGEQNDNLETERCACLRVREMHCGLQKVYNGSTQNPFSLLEQNEFP